MIPPAWFLSSSRVLKNPFSVLHSRIVTVERLTVTSVMKTWSATGLRASQYSGPRDITWLTSNGGRDLSSSSTLLLLLWPLRSGGDAEPGCLAEIVQLNWIVFRKFCSGGCGDRGGPSLRSPASARPACAAGEVEEAATVA